ncbi:MAG TPA: hypothetical protein VMH87_01385, partial [Pseudomonadales bacterium]|nr:hypothetical protein [Pseudomonadales bacterium]
VLSGTGGTAGNTYYVLSTTNLITGPWLPIATNTFLSPSGNFSVTNPIERESLNLFYMIKSQ